jgi:hypothetical protein
MGFERCLKNVSNQKRKQFYMKTTYFANLCSCKHSIALWTTYVYFERSRGTIESLRDVIHRGLSSLPWSKAFIMISLSILSNMKASFEELRNIYQVLEDRELRVHINIIDELDSLAENLKKKTKATLPSDKAQRE